MEYVNPTYLLLWAAALCVITAATHSVLGEQRIIMPMMQYDTGVLKHPLARQVTRIAWHWMSVLWVLVGAVLAFSAYGDIQLPWFVFAIGALHLVLGVADGVITRGQHVGWPLITLIGALSLLAFYVMQTQ